MFNGPDVLHATQPCQGTQVANNATTAYDKHKKNPTQTTSCQSVFAAIGCCAILDELPTDIYLELIQKYDTRDNTELLNRKTGIVLYM